MIKLVLHARVRIANIKYVVIGERGLIFKRHSSEESAWRFYMILP
jgi:hypothetical protein